MRDGGLKFPGAPLLLGQQDRSHHPSPAPTPGPLPTLQGRTKATGPRGPDTHPQWKEWGRDKKEKPRVSRGGEVFGESQVSSWDHLGQFCFGGTSAMSPQPAVTPVALHSPQRELWAFLKTSWLPACRYQHPSDLQLTEGSRGSDPSLVLPSCWLFLQIILETLPLLSNFL